MDEEAFAVTLEAHPRVVTMALDHPHDYVIRAHDAGSLVMHQVTTVQQARDAAARGVDIIIAQGGEAGGYGGSVATMTLVPQVVDAVRPLPVIAAGGITDGRGMAAALMLGAQGVNIGTRFLATVESPIAEGHKQAILDGESQDAIKADVWNDINPLPGNAGYFTVARALRTPFLDEWQAHREDVDPRAAAHPGRNGCGGAGRPLPRADAVRGTIIRRDLIDRPRSGRRARHRVGGGGAAAGRCGPIRGVAAHRYGSGFCVTAATADSGPTTMRRSPSSSRTSSPGPTMSSPFARCTPSTVTWFDISMRCRM